MFPPQSILRGVCAGNTTSDSEQGQSEIITSPNTLQLRMWQVSIVSLRLFKKCKYSHYFTWNSDMKCSASALSPHVLYCAHQPLTFALISLIIPRSPHTAITPQRFFKVTQKMCCSLTLRRPLPTSEQDVYARNRNTNPKSPSESWLICEPHFHPPPIQRGFHKAKCIPLLTLK